MKLKFPLVEETNCFIYSEAIVASHAVLCTNQNPANGKDFVTKENTCYMTLSNYRINKMLNDRIMDWIL
jgi:hypothetical protein